MAMSCVRVDPPLVVFNDVRVGQVYKTKLTVANVGKTKKKIIISKPGLKLFKFRASTSAGVLAPGLYVSGMLEFTPEKDEEVRDRLLIHVDNVETIEIPLLGFPRTCSLLTDSVLDFGCLAANGQVITKNHHITNQGSAPGAFLVEYNGDPSIRLSPRSGVISAGNTQWLKVEIRTDGPKLLDEKALVKLQNRSDVVVSIRAEVVDQRLEISDLQGAPLSCLWFRPAYFGTSSVKNVVLRNNSPQVCDWVGVLQNTAAETEVVSDALGGTHLEKSTDVALLKRMERCSPTTHDASKVLACVPKEGTLGPYEKTVVAVCFSPICHSKTKGWKHDHTTSRQDYSLFLLFESMRSRYGFTHRNGDSSVELAVTGSGLPVSLVPSPSERFNFHTCAMGQRVDLLCVLQNLCPQLPVNFRFRKLAHFTTNPSAGKIPPGQSQDVVLSFVAQQQGRFRMHQKLDILGHVFRRRDDATEDATAPELCIFHTITLHVSAVVRSETTHPVPKLNPGITPGISNPTGLQPHGRSSELTRCHQMARAAVLNAHKTQLNMHHRERSQNEQYRTISTGVHRYCYVDTSYAFTEEEEKKKQQHQQIYADFLKQLGQRQLGKMDDDVDIGIVPAQGLVPPTPRICDLETSKVSATRPHHSSASQATKRSCRDMTSTSHQVNRQVRSKVSGAPNAVRSSSQEVADYHRTLTPLELHQVDIGPLFVDFGEVCVQSVCVQKLELINNLSLSIWVQLEVDCPELQGSSPLSHALSPHSQSTIPLTFQSNKLGPFYHPVSFSVNDQHPGQIVVQAQVVPLALELSTNLLVLRPSPTLLAQSGYRGSVTLRNLRNHTAEFTWRPVVTDSGILFSIRPATGAVEPHRELDCEVVWHSSFSSPPQGDFDLCVHEGNTQRLRCVAKVGFTSVELAEKQIYFESVPLNMPSVRTAVLHNTGRNHAFYQVLDVCPLPGMVVSPPEGVVPRGGLAELEIRFNPDSVFKFDAIVKIALKSITKSIELRVGGSVGPLNIDISVTRFQFSGVYAGSQRAIPFSLKNLSSAPARVTFDLSEYADFSLQLPQPSGEKDPGVIVADVQCNQTMDCSLVFSPTQATSYDFDLPLMVNGVRWTAGALSASSIPSPGGRKNVVISTSVNVATPRSHRIMATVLFAPLELSPSHLQFHMEPLTSQSDTYTKTVELKAVCQESAFWRSGVREHVNWWFDCNANVVSTEDSGEVELCSVSPSSGSLGPGQSICLEVSISPKAIRTGSGRVSTLLLPLYLGEEGGEVKGGEKGPQPYRELSITITLQLPCITIHPRQILLTPVPLGRKETATLTLLASGYPSGTTVLAEVDEVLLEDGTNREPVSVVFPEGNIIPAERQDQSRPISIQNQEASVTSLICHVSFCSAIPLSICTTITFTDHLDNRFKVKLCAIAENCMLTVWPFMALRRSKQQIVLRPGTAAVEAIHQMVHTPSPASGPTSSSSSMFDRSSSTNKNSASGSFQDSDSMSSAVSMETDVSPDGNTPTNLGVPEFPAANSDQGLYYQNVLLAVESWFSLFGWPSGPHPISVPHTLRRVVSKIQTYQSSGRTYRVTQNKDSRSVVDMLHHLTGKQVPGIPCCPTFFCEIDQRTKQQLKDHEAILAFLRVQGALLGHIKPEYLLDTQEFKHWWSLQSVEEEHGLDYSSVDYESLSKRAWTDVLMQIYKVLVLRRVSESSPDTTLDHENRHGVVPFTSRPLSSNLYSSLELHLLTWLNIHYQNMRTVVWGTDTGGVPSQRWILNFNLDLADGLVLAALLAAYCPYMRCSHFRRMYTTTSNLEQILHNNIIVSQALNALCLNLDVQPKDLSDPNPVQMLMLCVHLHERLPHYLPQETITLSGHLCSFPSKRVHLKNPASTPVKYQALLLGENIHLFSLPDGSAVTIPPNSSTSLTVRYNCSVLQPMQAVLLLVSASPFGVHGTTLAFNLRTHVSHITPIKTVECKSPCYQPIVVKVPITNPFTKEAHFRVVLVESAVNPLKSEKVKDSVVRQASSKASLEKTTSDSVEETEGKSSDHYDEGMDFHSAVRSVCLEPGQIHTLNVNYLPFLPGTKFCTVLLLCPEVGDVVYMVEATAGLPLPSPLTARPSSNIESIPSNSDPSALTLHCKVGQACEEVLHVPLINMAWEQALATWGQYNMSADEYRSRLLTCTLNSSTVRARAAARKLLTLKATWLKGFERSKGVEYSVEVSLPQNFLLPSTVTMLTKEDMNPADGDSVDIPVRFQAYSVGQYTCQVVLTSCYDIRVYILEALVTSQGQSLHLDFSSPARQSVTQDIPLDNETQRDWTIHAEVCGEEFSGPKVLSVPAGARVCYPLTFRPAAQCSVLGKLLLRNDCDGETHTFTLRGVGERPPPVDHVVLRCPVGQTIETRLDVPNYSQNKLTLKVVTDLSVVSGPTSLEIKPGHNAPYTLAVSPWKRGKHTGSVSFLEIDDEQKANKQGNALGCYEVHFSLEVICEPAAPIRVIDVQCPVKSSVAIAIPVGNPRGEPLTLDVRLEGDDVSGADRVSIPPEETLTYKATFSPGRVGKSRGSVLFHSELVGEFWYRLELYALPPRVRSLPQACCQLGKWTRQTVPLVNPTADTLELLVGNTNPRNFSLEMDPGSPLIMEPHSSTQLGVLFSPSSIGEGKHMAKITFTCPELQEWCVLLRGRGLSPEIEQPRIISALIGSDASTTIPFTNPTEFQAVLDVTLTDEEPSGDPKSHQVSTDKRVFTIPLSQTEGIQIGEGGRFDVPVVFTPDSVEQQQAWLCVAMNPLSSPGNHSTVSQDDMRPKREFPTVCWIYPLHGIPIEMPAESSALGVLLCEAGCQMEKKFDLVLTERVPGNWDRKGQEVSQMAMEDFLCEVHSDTETGAEDYLSASIEAARRDPATGIVTLTLNVVYTPLEPCRYVAAIAVRGVSGDVWEFPVTLVATEPKVDDVIIIEATEVGKTSAVGFRLTSTTRRPEPFTAAFLPGGSGDFAVTPASGTLPPVGCPGALITVSFTPATSTKSSRRARLAVQAADMQWTYEVKATG